MELEYAIEQFEEYLNRYDREDDKVRLKIVHTYGVMDCSKEIARRMKLPSEDQSLARLIGLLHDIGRFEQLKRYDSFEPGTMDHAAFGARILFDEGMIRLFIKEQKWDAMIRTAIEKHSDFRLDGIEDERTLLHARLIRDADKLDNCRVKLVDDIETFMGAVAEDVGKEDISPAVREQFFRKESILSSLRKTKMDYWVSYLAYFFDINYKASFDMIKENDYVSRIVSRIPYRNLETRETMREMENFLCDYIEGIQGEDYS